MDEKTEVEDDVPLTSSQNDSQPEVTKERSVAGLLARLKTYASLPWSVKPIEVSPLVCSRHGWVSREPDSLSCVACSASLCIRLPSQSAENYGQQLMDTVTNLAMSHSSSDCPWHNDPMPDDTPLLPFTDPDADLQAFLKISESLAPVSAAVSANVRFTIHCPVARDLMEFVRTRSDRLLALPEEVRLRCCLLAVAGWSPADAPSSPTTPPSAAEPSAASAAGRLLSCCFCQRRIGLWNLNRAAAISAASVAAANAAAAAAAVSTPDDASLSDGVEAGMSLGVGVGVGGVVGSSMPAPSYALTEMIINRQLLFAKKQHTVSDWSIVSNAGSEAASIRDLDDVQSVAGSTVSNVSAGELANQLQDFDQQQQPPQPPQSQLQSQAPTMALLNLPPSSTGGGGGSLSGDPDNWSTVTNADSGDRRSVAQQSDVASVGGGVGGGDNGGGGGSKRARFDDGDGVGVGLTGGPRAASVDLLALHWPWCPWRPGDPSEDWCRSVLSHSPDLRQTEALPSTTTEAEAEAEPNGDEDRQPTPTKAT